MMTMMIFTRKITTLMKMKETMMISDDFWWSYLDEDFKECYLTEVELCNFEWFEI